MAEERLRIGTWIALGTLAILLCGQWVMVNSRIAVLEAQVKRRLNTRAHLLATFDNRTTLTCRHFGQLQKIYALDDPATPKPPLHFNCRSVLSLVPIGFDPFSGTKASVGGQDGQQAEEAYNKKKI